MRMSRSIYQAELNKIFIWGFRGSKGDKHKYSPKGLD